MPIETHLLISGKVQGVFFRAKTHQLATRLNLKGYVRNLSSGEVEVVILGEPPQEFLSLLNESNGADRVDTITVTTRPQRVSFSSFDIS